MEARHNKFVKFYLEVVYEKHLMNQPELAKKYKGKSFEYFYNDVVQQFTMECYKGLAIRAQLVYYVIPVIADKWGFDEIWSIYYLRATERYIKKADAIRDQLIKEGKLQPVETQ